MLAVIIDALAYISDVIAKLIHAELKVTQGALKSVASLLTDDCRITMLLFVEWE